MAIVRVPTDFPTISEAMAHVLPGDTIALDPGYSNETATVTVQGLTINGGASSLNIVLQLGSGILGVTLNGAASIAVNDNSGSNSIVGNAGDNALGVTGGVDIVDGMSGIDRLIVDYSHASQPVINPVLTPIQAGTIDGYAGVFTAGLSDTVTFDNIESFDIRGGIAGDDITTGGGNDILEGGAGGDNLNGADGFDLARYSHSNQPVTVDLSNNANNAGGDAQGDVLTGIEGVIGSGFNDRISGGSNSNTLNGGTGSDTLNGLGLADTLIGGPGADTFVFDAIALADALAIPPVVDRIVDFNQGNNGTTDPTEGDRIDLSSIVPSVSQVRLLDDGRLQVVSDGQWVTIATLDGLQPGDSVAVMVGGGELVSLTGVPAISAALFSAPVLGVASFGAVAGGWTSDNAYPRTTGDVDGNGMADIVGFGSAGTYVSLATGGGLFATPFFAVAGFGSSSEGGGWSTQDSYPRAVGDVNGDGLSDIVGFGSAGTYVSLATGGGNFGPTFQALAGFGSSPAGGGWSSEDEYPRTVGDVNGDGLADIVGFGSAGTYVSLATGGGNFGPTFLALAGFGSSPAGGGWTSQDEYPRAVGDVNGDGMSDIVGFGSAGTYVSLATGGGNFGPTFLALAGFGASPAGGGWTSQDEFPRDLGDVNGDGRADIVGFGAAGTYVAHARADGTFVPSDLSLAAYGALPVAGGWTSNDLYPRYLDDVTGDGRSDILGFGSSGVYVSQSVDFLIL